ncbi:MAG: cytochrome P460 [Acidobacteria bacterium]|nr:MAG: cytochrome P460 [Acidobacteriota bacterium]
MKYLVACGAAVLFGLVAVSAQSSTKPAAPKPASSQPAEAGPRYTAAGELIRPADFREWMFVTSGLGMTYNQPSAQQSGAPRPPNFTNVYVNPSSYRAYMRTGQWPDKTMFILEIRASSSEGSINRGGHFQSNLVVIEASVKDEARFPGKWAYFDFGRDMKPQVQALPPTERCYACHSENGAVDNTFVQFYPTLLEVARKAGTLRPSFAKAAAGH